MRLLLIVIGIQCRVANVKNLRHSCGGGSAKRCRMRVTPGEKSTAISTPDWRGYGT